MMFKRIVIFLFLVSAFNVSPGVAEVEQFRFSNWPLADFEQHQVLEPFGEEHFGIDIQAQVGQEVVVPADGVVYWTYSGGANGISAGIEHPNGWRTTYLHLSERLVKKGQLVKAGEVIGRVGITGTGRDSEAPHLHFGLIKNPDADINNPFERYADPLNFGPLVIEQPKPLYEQPSVSLQEESPTQQPATQQLINTAVEQVYQLNVAGEQMPELVNSPTTVVAAARMQKKLRQNSKLEIKSSSQHTTAVKKLVIARKPAVARKSISLRSLTEGWKVFKTAAKKSRGVARRGRGLPTARKLMLSTGSDTRSARTPRLYSKVRVYPVLMLAAGLLLFTLLLANLVRKSYNIVLT